MQTLNLACGISITFDNKINEDCQFQSLTTKESILGELPTAVLKLKCDKDILWELDKLTIKIDNHEGYSFTAKMYVYGISYLDNTYEVRLMSCNPDFTRKINSNKFPSYKSAVRSLYPGDIFTNSDTDLMNDIEIIQTCETDYKVLSKLLQAWKKNTIYGYALDGLRINDLNNYKSKIDDLSMKGKLKYLSDPIRTSPKLLGVDTEFLDYSDSKDPNHIVVKFYDKYIMVNTEYKYLFANYLYNTRFSSSVVTYNAATTILSPLNITDGVDVKNKDLSIEQSYVSSRIMTLEDNSIKVEYTFKSIKS